MSASLDRKIEAAKLRAETERKQAGGPALQKRACMLMVAVLH